MHELMYQVYNVALDTAVVPVKCQELKHILMQTLIRVNFKAPIRSDPLFSFLGPKRWQCVSFSADLNVNCIKIS